MVVGENFSFFFCSFFLDPPWDGSKFPFLFYTEIILEVLYRD